MTRFLKGAESLWGPHEVGHPSANPQMWCPRVHLEGQEPGSILVSLVLTTVRGHGAAFTLVMSCFPSGMAKSKKEGREWPDAADGKALARLTQQCLMTKPSCMGVLREAQAWFKFSPCDVAHVPKWRDGNGGVRHETWGHTAVKIILG